MFYYLSNVEIQQLTSEFTEDVLIEIDRSIVGKTELISLISSGIRSPYSQDNWDGLEEALQDLSWIPNKTVNIVHRDLPVLSKPDLHIYISILQSVVESWSTYHERLKVFFTEYEKGIIENITIYPSL